VPSEQVIWLSQGFIPSTVLNETMRMTGQRGEPHSDPVVAAIERVLKTEREGVETLRKSAADAECLLTETRAQAAALARRADRCISKLHTAYLQKIDRDIAGLAQAQAANGSDANKPYDAVVLSAAARRVAAKLTGGA
jgi:hypothetical protein